MWHFPEWQKQNKCVFRVFYNFFLFFFYKWSEPRQGKDAHNPSPQAHSEVFQDLWWPQRVCFCWHCQCDLERTWKTKLSTVSLSMSHPNRQHELPQLHLNQFVVLDCTMLILAYATPLCLHLSPLNVKLRSVSWRDLCAADRFSCFSWPIWLRSTTRSAGWLAAPTTPSTTPLPSSPPAGSSTPPPPWTFLGGTPPFTGAWAACHRCAQPSTTQSGWTVTGDRRMASINKLFTCVL